MTLDDPQGPLVLCYDGSQPAERAIRVAPVLVGRGRAARVLEADRRTAQLIAATADELDAPAIVMGQRGMSGLKSAVLGSVSRDVVNGYHRPVIVV